MDLKTSCLFFLIFIINCNTIFGADKKDEKVEVDPIQSFKLKYTTLFKGVRKQHFDAIKRIMNLEDDGKRSEMLKILIERSQEALSKAKAALGEFESIEELILKADSNTDIRNALSIVVENSAFHGDLALHFPDIYHKYYDKNEEFKNILVWCVKFSNQTGLFDTVTNKMLNFMAQELNIIPRSDKYINPYTLENKMKQPKEVKKPNKDKKKEKKKREPGMSTKTEL